MTDAAWLSGLRFASGADEKVTRVFDAPAGFVESLGTLGVASSKTDEVDAVRGPKFGMVLDAHVNQASRPKGATVPPLGLSNRALGKGACDGPTGMKELRYRSSGPTGDARCTCSEPLSRLDLPRLDIPSHRGGTRFIDALAGSRKDLRTWL
jgi:hypothetical protein